MDRRADVKLGREETDDRGRGAGGEKRAERREKGGKET